jgi:glycosyltransferase involved in cell wall biosynthesis
VAIVCDYLEEKWASMDLVAEMIEGHLARDHAAEVQVTRIRPAFRNRAQRVPLASAKPVARQADLLLNRFADYPWTMRRIARRRDIDLFHIVDHSYAQLVHVLPRDRTLVTCHDLDTFRCLLAPEIEPRPAWFRAMTRHTMNGFRRAGAVACDSEATRAAIVRHGLVAEERLTTVHLGTHPECTPEPDPKGDARATALLGPRDPERPELLHVGSNIPRKRVDVLLETFAGVRRQIPGARLVKVGGALDGQLADQARTLGITDAIATLPFLSPAALAALYRRASLVLQPSDAEGFGLPLAEAMACGAPLLVSGIPVLREIAGDAAAYAQVGDVPAWTAMALRVLDEVRTSSEPWRRRRALGLERARLFHWSTHTDHLVAIYRDLYERARAGAPDAST